MLRVRPGVLLVRASFAPTSELMTLDLPTLERPRNAISGTPGAGKWVKSLAESINRARIRIETVSSVWVAHGKRRGRKKFAEDEFVRARGDVSVPRPALQSDAVCARGRARPR